MTSRRTFSALSAAVVFGALALLAQTVLLRRFLWRFESAETGVALFLSCWLFWSGMGAALAATPFGRRLTGALSHAVWALVFICSALYFAQYALIDNLRFWLGVPEYQVFPILPFALGCLVACAPFCFVSGFVIPSICMRLEQLGSPVSRAFAWEALGAAAGGLVLTVLLMHGVAPDPRDEAEWYRFFPQATERPGRFETGIGTTFYGSSGGTFFAISSGGVSEVIPDGGRALEQAVLILSQRPYARDVLLVGQVPLAVGVALETVRPDLSISWCPCDALYGLNLMSVLRSRGFQTRVHAVGLPPQSFLKSRPEASYDVVLVASPSATSLGGAVWRDVAFAQSVRRVTRRNGLALFGLDCDAAILTPEKGALLNVTVRSVRQAWPESGLFAAGAGGWWLAAQVPRLVYGVADATNRFGMLKRDVYPVEAVSGLYDSVRSERWMRQEPILDAAIPVLLPETRRAEDILSLGLADALRRSHPATIPGRWLSWLKTYEGVSMAGLLLVLFWMGPVALGTHVNAPRRMLAAWLAACGALGLAVSLVVFYRLQMRFGSLYLLAGAGSCLYLAGLFCGNRLADSLLSFATARLCLFRWLLPLFTLVQVGVALAVMAGTDWMVTASGLVLLCFAVGSAAGLSVPTVLAMCKGRSADSAAVFVFADALGASVAGLFSVVLVPLAGMWETVMCFAVLACGMAVCVVIGSRHARLTAGLALLVTMALLGGHFRDAWFHSRSVEDVDSVALTCDTETTNRWLQAGERAAVRLQGIPRKVDSERVRHQMRDRRLSDYEAAYWTYGDSSASQTGAVRTLE